MGRIKVHAKSYGDLEGFARKIVHEVWVGNIMTFACFVFLFLGG